MHEASICTLCEHGLAHCGAAFIFVAGSRHAKEVNLLRPLLILAAVAALALIAGFLAFGGGNMGN
jgi:hypothetical protein